MIDGYIYQTEGAKEAYVLVQDDDSHWFLIPATLKFKFLELLIRENHKEMNRAFSKYVIDSPEKLIILDFIVKT
jgi:hypothetical protein